MESVEEGSVCLDQEGLASLQVIFNVFRQKPAEALFPRDRRHFNRDGAMFNVGEAFAELGLERGVDAAGQVARLVPEGMTMAQMALRRILDHREVSVVIPGASRPDQETANVSAADIAPLPAALREQLAGFHRAHVRDFIRGPY